LASDRFGNPVVDPTKNVLDLVEAANRRQDDLRQAEQAHMREVLTLRTELGNQDSKCAAEIAGLRAENAETLREIEQAHAAELRLAEAQRIDAIRQVDVEAVQRAAEVQSTAADRLAKQVTDSAEAMRTQVAAASEAATRNLATAVSPLTEAVAELRQAQYEAQGQKTQVVETKAQQGVSAGQMIALVGVAIAFLGLIAVVLIATLPH
jgi:hypothetical protein